MSVFRTDRWTILEPVASPGWAWRERKSVFMDGLAADRRSRGCDCEAPPWFSPEGEWPIHVMLAHSLSCAYNTLPEAPLTGRHVPPISPTETAPAVRPAGWTEVGAVNDAAT